MNAAVPSLAGAGSRRRRPRRARAAAVFARHRAPKPHRFDLFQAMRRIESAHPDKPRLGDALRPVDEPFRFAQAAALIFAPAPMPALRARAGRPAPTGAARLRLPRPERRAADPPDRVRPRAPAPPRRRTFSASWTCCCIGSACSSIAPGRERSRSSASTGPDDAPIVRHIGALFGLIEPSARSRDALGDFPKLFFAGRLVASVRDADGLKAWLTLAVRRAGARSSSSRALDAARPRRSGPASCGDGAARPSAAAPCSAEAVWDVQHKFRIVIGPLAWERFVALPAGRSAARAAARAGSAVRRLRVRVGPAADPRSATTCRVDAGGRPRPRVGRLGRTAGSRRGYRRTARCRRTGHECREHPAAAATQSRRRGMTAPAVAAERQSERNEA